MDVQLAIYLNVHCMVRMYSMCVRMYIVAYSLMLLFLTVRLVNGPTSYEGRVEIYHNGVWGTICDDGWDLNDAQVVCNELGFGTATAALRYAFYGRGSGPIWLSYLNCNGNEWSISNCSHGGWGVHYCGHHEDAGAKCTCINKGNL